MVIQAAGSGVHQGCILLPLLFAFAMDWVLRKTTDCRAGGIIWEGEDQLCDLDFADDITLITVHRLLVQYAAHHYSFNSGSRQSRFVHQR